MWQASLWVPKRWQQMSRAKQNKTSGDDDDDAGCRLPLAGWRWLGLSLSVKRVYAGLLT